MSLLQKNEKWNMKPRPVCVSVTRPPSSTFEDPSDCSVLDMYAGVRGLGRVDICREKTPSQFAWASEKNWNVEELETLPAGTLPGSRRRRKHLICKSETERGPERSCKINTQGRMYLWWSLRTLYLDACQVRVTVGDSGLCCWICVTYSELWLAPFCVALSIS